MVVRYGDMNHKNRQKIAIFAICKTPRDFLGIIYSDWMSLIFLGTSSSIPCRKWIYANNLLIFFIFVEYQLGPLGQWTSSTPFPLQTSDHQLLNGGGGGCGPSHSGRRGRRGIRRPSPSWGASDDGSTSPAHSAVIGREKKEQRA